MAKVKTERKIVNSLNNGFLRERDNEDIYWDLGDEDSGEDEQISRTIKERLHHLETELEKEIG